MTPQSSGASLAERLTFAETLAREAGALALRHFRDPASYRVRTKGLQDQATDADVAVENLIMTRLAARYPSDGRLGEETGGMIRAGVTWIIDPIDGTQCFLNRIPVWCVSLGLADEHGIAGGVVFDPNADEMFVACRGGGAFVNGQPLRASDATDLGDGIVGVGYSCRTAVNPAIDVIRGLAAEGGMFQRNGSGALMLAYVAAGRLLGYYEAHINAWDCAAGLALVAEAGGWSNDFVADGGLSAGGPILSAAPGVAGILRGIVARAER